MAWACWLGGPSRSARPWQGLAAVLLLLAVALAVDWRGRIAVAGATALALGALQTLGAMAWQPPRWTAWLARISYPVFLVHFAVLLGVGTAWGLWFPRAPWANLAGMVLVFALSLVAGAMLQRLERGAGRLRAVLGWQLAVLAAGMVVMAA
jgi:peptidoglycan/LPS O-acetylase OafA/YrhL